MSNISEKTLNDLEFHTILQSVKELCISKLGKQSTLEIKPFKKKEKLLIELLQVNEYLGSYINENKIPNHYFDDVEKEIHLLKIENSYLEPTAFLRILNTTTTVFELLKFFKKFSTYYPTLFKKSEEIEYEKFIDENIQKYITPFAEVNDNSSPT